MQSHTAISIAYCISMKKDHQTLLNFAILAGKWQETHLFHIKSPVKNFHGRAKGGHRTVPPSPKIRDWLQWLGQEVATDSCKISATGDMSVQNFYYALNFPKMEGPPNEKFVTLGNIFK